MVVKKYGNRLFYPMQSTSGNTNDRKRPVPNKYSKSLGRRVKDLRIKAGYKSYEDIAYKYDISRTQWGRIENGQDLRFSSLAKVIEALGITFSEFFDGFEELVKGISE